MRLSLPIDPLLPDIVAAVRARGVAVVVAAPGSGKTTRVPGALLDGGAAGAGRVVVLQPRRVAARAAAARISEERGGKLGEEVGYQVRFERRQGPSTRIELLTEGLLARRLVGDPLLTGGDSAATGLVGCVVLDEVHERNLHTDLVLALLVEARQARPDLALVLMSATLDAAAMAAFLGGDGPPAPIIEAPGRVYPVDLRYAPRTIEAWDRDLPEAVALTARQALREADGGTVLCFLPGVGEISRCQALLGDAAAEVLPLHGSLSPEAQDRAIGVAAGPRIVLATNVAETSLTLPGVRAVVDGGLHRAPLYDPALGLSRLLTQRISRASAEQRAGRAGRTGPGTCHRLWTEERHHRLAAFDLPELQRADLVEVCLLVRAWGGDPGRLSWFEPPPGPALAEAEALLRRLGATDGRGLTPLGRDLSRLPTHPRLAAVVREGHRRGCLRAAAGVASLAGERDPWRAAGALDDRLSAIDRGRPPPDAHPGAFRQLIDARDQLIDVARGAWGPERAGAAAAPDLVTCLLSGFPDRVARRREPGGARLQLASGTGAVLEGGGPAGELMVAITMDAGRPGERVEHRVRLAAGIDRRDLDPAGIAPQLVLEWDVATEAVRAFEARCWLALELERRPIPTPRDDPAVAALLAGEALRRGARPQGDAGESLRCRVALLRAAMPELDLPAVGTVEELLPRLCLGLRSFAELRQIDVQAQLLAGWTWAQQQALERHAPTRFALPSGAGAAISYGEGAPVLAARIQQLFGMADTPRIAQGRVPLQLHLLGPNNRPVQVTQDLAGFWATTWPEVRKDLRGRYPRHAWPDDPLVAEPTDRARRRG